MSVCCKQGVRAFSVAHVTGLVLCRRRVAILIFPGVWCAGMLHTLCGLTFGCQMSRFVSLLGWLQATSVAMSAVTDGSCQQGACGWLGLAEHTHRYLDSSCASVVALCWLALSVFQLIRARV